MPCLRVVHILQCIYHWFLEKLKPASSIPEPPSFPFCDLPVIAQRLILEPLDTIDLFLVAVKSKKFREIMRRAYRPVESVKCSHSDKNLTITMNHFPDISDEFQVVFRVEESDNWRQGEQTTLKLGNTTVIVTFRNSSYQIFEETPNKLVREELFCLLSDAALNTFPTKNLTYEVYHAPIQTVCHVISLQSRFQNLSLHGTKWLTAEEVKVLLEDTTSEQLIFTWWVDLVNVKNLRVKLKQKYMRIQSAFWLGFESLLDLECERLDITDPEFTSENVNLFVKMWMNGGFEKLEVLNLLMNIEPFDLEIVFEGIQYRICEEDVEKKLHDRYVKVGREIQRSDGRMAKVVVFSTTFHFEVLPEVLVNLN